VRGLIEPLFDRSTGPVTWWTSNNVRVWSERPWNNQGTQLDPVFHAAVDFSVKFNDFEALAHWVEATAAVDGVTVSAIEWSLTIATRTSATVEVRSRAVKDAVAKATVFAQSIGLGAVTATALADPGMLGDSSGAGGSGMTPAFTRGAMTSAMVGNPGGSQLALKPEEISVASTVDARFIAR
jgi:uncharacterized protein